MAHTAHTVGYNPAAAAWRRFRRHTPAMVGLVALLAMVFVAALAPWLAPFDRDEISPAYRLLAPGSPARDGRVYLLGSDYYGRDLLTRLMFGGRISLAIGFLSVAITVGIGSLLGALAGYYGGWVDSLVMRLGDVMLSIPRLVLVITALAFLRGETVNSIYLIVGILGLTGWAGTSRLVRAEFLSLREREFAEAARALGAAHARVIFRHILPNAFGPIVVSGTLNIAGAILTEAVLSFLGVGVQPPVPSWGNMLFEAQNNLREAWWYSLFPGLTIMATTLSFYLVGDGLRDALDPRLAAETASRARRFTLRRPAPAAAPATGGATRVPRAATGRR